MGTPNPYDLNDLAEARMETTKEERPNRSRRKNVDHFGDPSDDPSPYDLSSHGGLACLAKRYGETR